MEEMYMTVFDKNIEKIAPENVPVAVDQCLSSLGEVQKRVNVAINKAARAKGASDKAKSITLRWYKIGDKAAAIEALQDAMVGMVDAQGDQAAAIKKMLEYQQAVANGMKFLLMLGIYNVANSRIVVNQLEMRLKGASEQEISEMARNEMRAVIAQIKAQLDLQAQQSRLAEAQKRVKEMVSANERGIASLSEHEDAQDAELKAHRQAGERLEQEVKRQALKDKEHDAALQKQADKDVEHDVALAKIRKVLEEHKIALDSAKKMSRMSKLAVILASASLIVSILTVIGLIVCRLK